MSGHTHDEIMIAAGGSRLRYPFVKLGDMILPPAFDQWPMPDDPRFWFWSLRVRIGCFVLDRAVPPATARRVANELARNRNAETAD